jgi:rfaE bifunctional protein kinase chain/domain
MAIIKKQVKPRSCKPVATAMYSRLQRARVLVVGDVMLDRYWFGEVNRISPEAPVPVLKVERIEERLGGAANVARNAAALTARTGLLSVVGRDEAGLRLQALLKDAHIAATIHHDASVSTTVKLRLIGRQQQLLRADFEAPPGREVLESTMKDYRRLLKSCDVVILSDYGKGGLAHIAQMIQLAKRQGKPVLVDPKGDDYARYRGATLLTPNRSELSAVTGQWRNELALTTKAQALREKLGLQAILVTRSEEGMTLYERGARMHIPAQAREVYDVSGAGDTVIATIAVMLAAGHSLVDAVTIANRAAGIVVAKFGTAVVYPNELFSSDGEA